MRNHPAFPCPYCGFEDWSFDRDLVRWICNTCFRNGKPTPVKPSWDSFDFHVWYKSILDSWETISRALAEHESAAPTTLRDQLIHTARQSKLEEEYKQADALATIASTIKLLMGENTGEFYIKLPDLDIEIGHKW